MTAMPPTNKTGPTTTSVAGAPATPRRKYRTKKRHPSGEVPTVSSNTIQ